MILIASTIQQYCTYTMLQETDVTSQLIREISTNPVNNQKVHECLQKKANLDVLIGNRYSLFEEAMNNNAPVSVLEYLLQYGASINQQTPLYGSALHAAAKNLQSDYVAWLISHGADVNAPHARNGNTPLHMCLQSEENIPNRDTVKKDIAEKLIRAGASSFEPNNSWHTPISEARDRNLFIPLIENTQRERQHIFHNIFRIMTTHNANDSAR